MECITELPDVQLRSETEMPSLYRRLQQVKDERGKRGRRYEAALILTLLLVAKMAGERTVSGAAEWVKLHQAELRRWLPLVRLPCANTYVYVCDHIAASDLLQQVSPYLATRPADAPPSAPPRLVQKAIDGKELRGTRQSGESPKRTQGSVSVYDVESGVTEQMIAIRGKGQERAAAQQAVQQAVQQGCGSCLVMADALHTQVEFCQTIRQQGGDYLLLVKRNQRQLYEDIAFTFQHAPHPLFAEASAHNRSVGHGRITVRHLRSSTLLNDYLAERWGDVAQVFQIERRTTRHGKTRVELVYGFTSLAPTQASAEALLADVQRYWRIENRNHWRRDATLGEDACHGRQPQAAQTLAALNTTLLALFDRNAVTNARSAIRFFAANLDAALALLLDPL